jgi:molecular chaperone HtpG
MVDGLSLGFVFNGGRGLRDLSSVVARATDSLQNSIDEVGVQGIEDQAAGASPSGSVSVTWDSNRRHLTVADTGTGMTQDTVEGHLLKVGASVYQEPEFKGRTAASDRGCAR